jgi:hypothetical protein
MWGKEGVGMKNGLPMISVAIFTSLIFVLPWRLTVAEEPSPPDTIVIDNGGYEKDRKGPVSFSHLSHTEDYEASCDACHHVYQEGENVWKEGDAVKKCGDCHSPLESKENVKKLSIAFHKNCKSCHKKALKEGVSEDAPFKSCYHCHEREP